MPSVAVFFGGASNESEISVITGMLAVNLLRGTQYRVVPVYLPPSGGMATGAFRGVEDFASSARTRFVPVALEGRLIVRTDKRRKEVARADVALNCCHGGMGEDGTLAALLRWNGIPSASPAAAPCGAFMDKAVAKLFAAGLNIPVAPSFTVREGAWKGAEKDVLAQAEAFGYPLVVKPARLGSSIGVAVAREGAALKAALDAAFSLDDKAVVERYFADKRDINCAAYRRRGEIVLSPCEEVFSGGDVLSFREKYEAGKGSKLPADLPEEVAGRIRGYTRALCEAFGIVGVVRADFLVSGDEVYFNELNMVPGSLAGYLFGGSLAEVRRFYLALLEEAFTRPLPQKRVIRTGILDGPLFCGSKSCKRRGNFV